MAVQSDRRWDFSDSVADVWTAITEIDRYQQWWPWLRRFDAGGFAEGERWRCTVKPQLPYRVHFDIVLESVVEHESAVARLEGDLTGSARLELCGDAQRSELRLISELEAVAGPARLVERLVPGLASAGHDWILDRGIQQFSEQALAKRA